MKAKITSCRMEISYIFVIMRKVFIFCFFVAGFIFSGAALGQEELDFSEEGYSIENISGGGSIESNEADESEEEQYDPDEQPLILPKGEMFQEGPTIENVIEGVGTVVSTSAPIYSAPDRKSKVLRYAIRGEKVTVIENSEEWYHVRMYNGKDGYAEKRNIKTVKVFYDESVTANQMDKRLNIELLALIDKFNGVLRESVYAGKFQIIPRLTMIQSSKRDNIISVTLEYSAVDSKGTVIPSMQTNFLSAEMRYFLELLFMKMLTANATEYCIMIRKPVFSPTGQVLHIQKDYAEVRVKHKDVPFSELKRQRGKILAAAKCSMLIERVFVDFPN